MNKTSKKIQYTLPDGTLAHFSRYNLKTAIQRAIASYGQRISQQVFLEEMDDSTGNSFSAIKHWLAGHNVPSDLDKLQAVANYLKVELTDLLETEKENNAMTNTITPIKAVDFSETKNTIRDIYTRMADYIEMFRSISVNSFGEDKNFVDHAEAFPGLYTAIMHSRLDLPTAVFNDLSSFASNYLQQMFCYLMFNSVVADDDGCLPERIVSADCFYEEYSDAFEGSPWFDFIYLSIDQNSVDGFAFAEAAKRQYLWNNDECNVWFVSGEIIANAAYSRLNDILNNYFVH